MLKPLNRFFIATCIATPVLSGQPAHAQDTPEPTPAEQEQAQPPTAEPRTAPDVRQRSLELLADELSDENVEWLSVEGDTFPVVWTPDATGDPVGAVLLIHGAGQTLDWPGSIGELRATLVDFGWSTLSITLPEPEPEAPPERPTDSPPDEDTTDNATPATAENTPVPPPGGDEIDPKVAARMKAAMNFLNSKGQFNIAIAGEGLGALRAAQYVNLLTRESTAKPALKRPGKAPDNGVSDRPIRALVLINARNLPPATESADSKPIYAWFNDKGLPILDIFFGNHYLDELEPQARGKAARKKKLSAYVQLPLVESPATSSTGETVLSRRIRGFLVKNAKGVELGGGR